MDWTSFALVRTHILVEEMEICFVNRVGAETLHRGFRPLSIFLVDYFCCLQRVLVKVKNTADVAVAPFKSERTA